jgi:hypothetical protein
MRTTMKMLTVLRAAAGGGVAAPEAPTGLTATVFSTSRIDLTWTDNATDETGYKVYRSTDNVSFSVIDTIAADSEAYSDTTITAGTTYYYKVAAYNAGGEAAGNVDAANTLTLNLVSWWSLDEASGQRNDSHGTNHLADNNTVTQAAGKVGNAAQFTAANSEVLSIASNTSLETGAVSFYYAGWYYADSFHASAEQWLAGKMGGSTHEWLIHKMGGGDNRLRITIRNAEVLIASTFGALTTGTWYFVEGWHDQDAGQIGIAVNGVTNTASRTTAPTAGTSEFVIGGRKGLSSFWDGRCDEALFIKGRIPTAAERASLYNGGNGRGYAYVSPL